MERKNTQMTVDWKFIWNKAEIHLYSVIILEARNEPQEKKSCLFDVRVLFSIEEVSDANASKFHFKTSIFM